MSHRSPDAGPQCANELDSVQQDFGGHRELLAEQYAFARWGAAHLSSLQPKLRITAAVVDAANAAAGCRRATRGGGFWFPVPYRAVPPPLPQLEANEAPTNALCYCRERDRHRFTPAEFLMCGSARTAKLQACAAYSIVRAK